MFNMCDIETKNASVCREIQGKSILEMKPDSKKTGHICCFIDLNPSILAKYTLEEQNDCNYWGQG